MSHLTQEPNPNGYGMSLPDRRVDIELMRSRGFALIGGFCILAAAAIAVGLAGSLDAALLLWGAGTTVLLLLTVLMWRELVHEDERKARRIRDRDFRYRQTLALLPEGVVILRDDNQIEWLNDMALRHLGFTPDVVGKPLFEVLHDERLRQWMQLRDYKAPLVTEPEGTNLILEVAAVAPDARHTMIVTRDVTEGRRLEEVRRDFVANVSHELRTPLTVISGFLDLEKDDDGTNREVLAYHRSLMREQTKRMRMLLDDLLTLSRLENEDEGSTDEPDVVAMPKLVEDVVREGKALSMGKHDFRVEIEDVSLVGFADELRSAAMNLVSNAVRYTPEGGSITVRWGRFGTGSCFSVTDTGIGIDAKHIPRLTERFYRVDKGRSRATGGTGLGLAIVKHILRHNGGTLAIESTPGKGSTFSMRFPEARTFSKF